MIAAPCAVLSGCVYAAVVVGGALDVSGVDPIEASAENQERQANAAANEDAERKRQRENEQIRATGKSMRAEREREEAKRAAEAPRAQEAGGVIEVVVEPRPPGPRAPSLDATMVRDAMAEVKTNVMSCRAQSAVKGQVLVSVKVAPDGYAVAVVVKSTPDPALGSCVAAAVQKATFTLTDSGGSFRYPFLF